MYNKNIKEIETQVANYFEGIFYGNISKLNTCFHEDAYLYGDIKGVDYLKSFKAYSQGVKDRQSPNDLEETFKMSIIGIDIIGKIAMVKLHVPMLGYNYYDYLSFSKINNEWKIVNKIFTHVD
ncbi:nuclear transport factor 2 family protein [uncultured Psychroserpens sp.]|uniref:nuclear transport factor 2 family protein n=1 Tax=uncultured Psychroserpens sp. TaxID=255436 RepID=UPI00263597A9|nr:nuclear transport factor 2 family protein [uncultured Psychroserpens sp.]